MPVLEPHQSPNLGGHMKLCVTVVVAAAPLLIFAPSASGGPRCLPDQTACCPSGYIVAEHPSGAMTCSPDVDVHSAARNSIPI